MTPELMFLRQWINFDVLLQFAFIVGLFAIVMFRREAIVSHYKFRLACLVFVLSYILPVILQPIVQVSIQSTGGGAMPFSTRKGAMKLDFDFFLQLLGTSIGPVLFGTALMLCIGAMLPREDRAARSPATKPPGPHPLD